jgi:hypothetical protein
MKCTVAHTHQNTGMKGGGFSKFPPPIFSYIYIYIYILGSILCNWPAPRFVCLLNMFHFFPFNITLLSFITH